MGTVVHVDFGGLRGGKSYKTAKNLTFASVVDLHDYEVTFSRGWLRAGTWFVRLKPERAGDLAEGLYWALMSSKAGKPSKCESVPGLSIVGEHPSVRIVGFGRPMRGDKLFDLIAELKNFYQRRRRRSR